MEERIRSNRRKIYCGTTVYLVLLMGVGVLFAYWILSINHATSAWIYVIIMALLNGLIIYVAIHYGLRFILWICKAAPVIDDREFQAIKEAVEDVSMAAGIIPPDLMFIDVGSCNAFSLNAGDNGTIIFTRGLTETLYREELQAVVAHEIAHTYNEDVALNTTMISIRGFSLFIDNLLQWFSDSNLSYEGGTIIANVIKFWVLFLSGELLIVLYFTSVITSFTPPARLVMTLIVLLSIPVNLVCITMFSYLMQRLIDPSREMIADELSARLTMDPEALVRAIEKVSPHSALYSMKFLKAAFFVPPYFTNIQPTPQERIRYLQDTLHMKFV